MLIRPGITSLLLALLIWSGLPRPAGAQAVSAADARHDGGAAMLRQFVERSAGHPGGRVEVTLGQLDPRIQLAPCGKIEPYLPAGMRLWGRASIGVRCVEGATWSVLLPVTVSVFSPALVANSALAAGSTPTEKDFRLEEVDLAREHGAVISNPAQLAGQVMARPIAAGQPIRADHLRIPPTIAAGDPVKVHVTGEGFSIAAEGIALAAAGDGQPLRVRTENGRILSGVVRDRVVEIKL